MTEPFPIKHGDCEPTLECLLVDVDGKPADLSGVTELKVAIRDAGSLMPKLTRDATVVDPSHQTVGHVNRGRVRVVWDPTDTTTLGVGEKELEFQAVRGGRPVSWPSEGYVPMTVWQDIVPDPES